MTGSLEFKRTLDKDREGVSTWRADVPCGYYEILEISEGRNTYFACSILFGGVLYKVSDTPFTFYGAIRSCCRHFSRIAMFNPGCEDVRR